jgi:hypothetical protein
MPSPFVGTAKQAQKFSGLTNFLQLSQRDSRRIAPHFRDQRHRDPRRAIRSMANSF